MNLTKLKSLQGWKDLALEVAHKGGAGSATTLNPDWRIDRGQLEHVSLRVPTRYEWPDARLWADGLFTGLRKLVPIKVVEIEQNYSGVILFQLVVDGIPHDVTLDYFDLPRVVPECANRSLVYFKMQYSREGYDSPNIIPGGYVPDSRKLYLYLPKLRSKRDKNQFEYEVYGRFSLDYAKDRRREAVELLRRQKEFRFEGGLSKVGYVDFLKQITRAKICIDLPGNGDFCHRLINYLAIGACVIGPRHGNELHVPLVDRKHIAFAKDDLSDLVDLCAYYLENDEAREEMCRQSRLYFETYLHRDNLAAYYLRTMLDHLPAASS
jgi:hypothetical protein